MYNDDLVSLPAPICSICHKPVPLNNAKTDEDGIAIHEACYLVKLGVSPGSEDDLKSSNVSLLRNSLKGQSGP